MVKYFSLSQTLHLQPVELLLGLASCFCLRGADRKGGGVFLLKRLICGGAAAAATGTDHE